jgi:putative ABC transport system permease protein
MMAPRLLRLIGRNLRRNLGHNLLSSIGIVVGIASFTFFLSLAGGVEKVVLGKIFPVDRLVVVPPKSSLFGSSKRITDEVVKKLTAPPASVGVKPKAVFPKMRVAFPARGWGGRNIFGRNLYFEVSGLCDGLDHRIMEGELVGQLKFVDYDAEQKKVIRCKNTPTDRCPDGLYCAWDVNECRKPVPAMISPYMIELYNGTIASSQPNMPKIPDFVTSMFAGRTFTVELGRSYLGSRARRGGKPIQRRFQLIGVSDKATPLGLTIPLGYIKRWNARYAGQEQATAYTSVILVVSSKADLTALAAYVKKLGFNLAENQGEKVGVFITLATVLFAMVSLIIIIIAAINIAHTFMMLIAERRREIGVLRAVGASRNHIRLVILGEAAVVGFLGGTIGILLAYVGARGADWFSATRVPDFPFKPETYFDFTPALVLASLAFAVLFCLLGALLPASRAAGMEPADALSTR